MMDILSTIVNSLSGFLYSPWVPLLLILAGLWFTFRTKFMQIHLFKESIKVITEKPVTVNGTSSFGALMVSTASRVGTGNIVGVSTAICLGGPGAIFWMWMTAVLGGATAFIESTLAQIYKRKNEDGSSYGGPSYYMDAVLHKRWLGVIFAFSVIFTYAIGYNLLAAYNLQSTFSGFAFYSPSVTPYIIGVILAGLFAICVLGGGKRIIAISGFLVPFMGVIYIMIAIIILGMNFTRIPGMFASIFASAFDFEAIFGGFAGSAVMLGIKRGLYSNEAGMGSAPHAAAAAAVSHPVKQGLVQMLSVFIDTLLICSATGLMCLCSDLNTTLSAAEIAKLSGAPYVQAVMGHEMGHFGPVFLCASMSLFAFTTLIGNYYYCEGCLQFILKRVPSKSLLFKFRIFASLIVFLGAIISMQLAWDTADLAQAIMVIINVPVILIIGKIAINALDDYVKQSKEGKNPVFKAASINLKQDTDFWK